MKLLYKIMWGLMGSLSFLSLSAKEIVKIPVSEGDMTLKIRSAIESSTSEQLTVILEKGTYYCKPDYAVEKYCAITNHGNGNKKIIFLVSNRKSVKIIGNGAKILCHGQIFPFLFENCGKVDISDIIIDWDIPFTFLAEVIAVNPEEGWRDIRPKTEGFSWIYDNKQKQICFPNIDNFNYLHLGSTLPFDKETKKVVDGALDIRSNPTKVEKLKNGNFRIYEKTRYYPPVGSLLNSKGDRKNDRYAPAFDFKECRNVTLNNITVHHALGMGFLFERTENIKLLNSQIVLPENSDRVVSTTADATHFCNCKGDILIESCRFENMLDDGTNVHGTYVVVDDILDSKTVRVALQHFQQLGFKFAAPGDEIWFVIHPSSERTAVNKIVAAKILNEKYIEYTFENKLPKDLKKGDILENKTWNPSFTMRGCTIRHHRARSILLHTPCKIVIEDNDLSSMMSSILFSGEAVYWYESGAVKDAIIRSNRFSDCAYCNTQKHAVIRIDPIKMGDGFDPKQIYHSNIRVINNTISGRNPNIITGNNVDGLIVKGNTIDYTKPENLDIMGQKSFTLKNSSNVTIEDNELFGNVPDELFDIDKDTRNTLKIDSNKTVRNKN